MEIRINDLDYAYDILSSPCHDYFDLECKGLDFIMHDSIELPLPLKSSVFVCKKITGKRYSAGIHIEQRGDNAFKNTSGELERKTALNGESFFITSKNGTGYIISEKLPSQNSKESSLCISETEEARIIAIGCRGTRPRILTGKDIFIESINYLEKYLNIFLDVVYEKYFGKKTLIHNIPRDFIVYSTHNSP